MSDEIDEMALVSELLVNETIDIAEIEGRWFKNPTLGKIVDEIRFLVGNGREIDIFYIAEKAHVNISFIEKIIDYRPILFDYEQSVERLKERYIKQQIATLSQKVLSGNPDTHEMIDRIDRILIEISETQTSNVILLRDALAELENDMERAEKAARDGVIYGMSSGFKSLDKITGGFDDGDLIVIAARPAMGKTTLALNMATEQAKQGTPVLFFSFEMTEKELRNKILARYAEVNSQKIKNGYYTNEEKQRVLKAAKVVEDLPIYITMSKSYDPLFYRDIIRKEIRKNKIKAVYLDHIGLTIPGLDPNKEIQRLSKEFKNVAMKEKIPIFVVSQLSRAVEKRDNKRPLLSDLRDSGTLEQDANKVIFLYRDSYYQKKEEPFNIGEDKLDKTEVIVAKNRNGAVGTVFLGFNLAFSDFVEIDLRH